MHEHHIPHTLTSEEQHRRMLQTPVPRLILSLAAPTVASQLISIIYNTADTFFVSQISTSASAAVGVVFSLQSIIQAYGFGVAMGAGSLISLRLGEKKDRDANMYATSGFLAEFVGGLLMLVFGLLYLEPLIRVLGATETMLPHACAYGRIILMGAPIMCGSFILNCILRAEGAAVASMIGLCSGGILNIALDPLLIFTFGMGTAGAAVATVISQCMSFLVLAVAFLRGRSIVHLRPKYISRSPRDYVQILAVGFPTIARQGMASLASALMNIQGAVYGDAAVAALTISNKIYLLVRNVIIGIGQGFQPVAGYNYGAGDRKRTRQAFIFATKLGTVICILAAAIIAAFADHWLVPRGRSGHCHRAAGAAVCLRGHAVYGVLHVRQPALPVPGLQAPGDGACISASGHLLSAAHFHPAAFSRLAGRADDAARLGPSDVFHLHPLPDRVLPQASA